jgi:hypothetical protein
MRNLPNPHVRRARTVLPAFCACTSAGEGALDEVMGSGEGVWRAARSDFLRGSGLRATLEPRKTKAENRP